MNKKTLKTHVAIVLDRSGSMGRTAAQTVQAYNEQVEQMKLNSKDGQEIFCSLVTFNGDVFEHLWDKPAEELTLATAESYQPAGSTAMRDAVGYTAKKLLDTTDQNDPDAAYLMIIISDGEENASSHFSISALKELVESCQATKKWTFTYIGCSEVYLQEVAKQTSIPVANMAAWSNATTGHAAAGLSATNTRIGTYYTERKRGATYTCNAMSDDSAVAANFVDVDTPIASDVSFAAGGTTSGSTSVFTNSVLVQDWSKYESKTGGSTGSVK